MPAAQPFSLQRPESVTETVAILAEHNDDARIMAGGQSLVPLLTLGFSSPAVVVSLDRCDEINLLQRSGENHHIGAMTTTARLEDDVALRSGFPLIAHAASMVGSPHVRNFGTAVGNVCHADPGSDLIPALLCHDAVLTLQSVSGQRSLALDGFITGPFTTLIDEAEMAVGVEVIGAGGAEWAYGYRKLVKRTGDLAMATCAVRLRSDDGQITDARIALGGVLSVAARLRTVERRLIGTRLGEAPELTLTADLQPDIGRFLMADAGAPLDYLELMLPRFIAATVDDAAKGVRPND